MQTDRRRLILGLGTLALTAALPRARSTFATPPTAAPTDFLHQDPELVQAVVGASHFDFDRVRELVELRPELARAAWDWGFGDWETALGAASHTGRREIAEYLMSQGARANLFTFAMLGHLGAVQALIAAQPGIQSVPGPHGITLLSHAHAGGEKALPVVQYLERLGGADPKPANIPLDDPARDALLGDYRTDQGVAVSIAVHPRHGLLTLTVNDGTGRNLFHQGDLVFHPAGAPSVRVAFSRPTAEAATSLEIRLPEGPITARRVVGS